MHTKKPMPKSLSQVFPEGWRRLHAPRPIMNMPRAVTMAHMVTRQMYRLGLLGLRMNPSKRSIGFIYSTGAVHFCQHIQYSRSRVEGVGPSPSRSSISLGGDRSRISRSGAPMYPVSALMLEQGVRPNVACGAAGAPKPVMDLKAYEPGRKSSSRSRSHTSGGTRWRGV